MSILFNSKSPEWSFLSNMFVSPMIIDGKEYLTVEHWFQSQKFTNPELQEKIRLCKSPFAARKLGKTRDESFRTDWDVARNEVMKKGVREKFQQNAGLRDRLLGTGTSELKEDSSWDSYWGSGRSGKGRNQMGILLMELRSEFS
jgi:ribA/ribD-fused uncharacterized protein